LNGAVGDAPPPLKDEAIMKMTLIPYVASAVLMMGWYATPLTALADPPPDASGSWNAVIGGDGTLSSGQQWVSQANIKKVGFVISIKFASPFSVAPVCYLSGGRGGFWVPRDKVVTTVDGATFYVEKAGDISYIQSLIDGNSEAGQLSFHCN
jgi:hypothetical protein